MFNYFFMKIIRLCQLLQLWTDFDELWTEFEIWCIYWYVTVLPCTVRLRSTSSDSNDIPSPPCTVVYLRCVGQTSLVLPMTLSSHLVFGWPISLAPSHMSVITNFSNRSLSWRGRSTLTSALWSCQPVLSPSWSDFWDPYFLLLQCLVFTAFCANTTLKELIYWLVHTFFLSMLRNRRLR